MMFRPIYLLPGAVAEEQEKLRSRWDDSANETAKELILAKIRAGAGEDFLQWDFEQGKVPFIDYYTDLRGLSLEGEDIRFPEDKDNFDAIDFKFARFFNSKFRSACFFRSHFELAWIVNCEFINCRFSFMTFFGCTLENVTFSDCSFGENNAFMNCDLSKVKFTESGYSARMFFDCRFDARTSIADPKQTTRASLANVERAEFFKGIREAYETGEVVDEADRYFFLERQSVTRYNVSGRIHKGRNYVLEYVTGYGIMPFRVFLTMLIVFSVCTGLFILRFGVADSLMLSAGAFLTFGALVDLLKCVPSYWRVFYVTESFVGVALMATFITVLARKWLGRR